MQYQVFFFFLLCFSHCLVNVLAPWLVSAFSAYQFLGKFCAKIESVWVWVGWMT